MRLAQSTAAAIALLISGSAWAGCAPGALKAAESVSSTCGLPPIEAIDAGSDIRAFLAPGVPAELTRAALRRAWSADPAIRNFVGLSENSSELNALNGGSGFDGAAAEIASFRRK
jgi:hypothetical protein